MFIIFAIAISVVTTIKNRTTYTDDKFISAVLAAVHTDNGVTYPYTAESLPWKIGAGPLCVKFSVSSIGGSKSYDTAITMIEDLKPGDPIEVLYLETTNSAGNTSKTAIVTQHAIPTKSHANID